MENGDIWETHTRIFSSYKHHKTRRRWFFFSCIAVETHAAAVGVDDADAQRTVLHVALQVKHGALTS